ncbi:MAG: ATP-binding protein [Pseudomonadota bacterium]
MEQRVAADYQLPLQWLDHLLQREVLRLRARYELSLDEFRGLYVSDAQVDALLAQREEDEDTIGLTRVRADASRLRADAWQQLDAIPVWRHAVATLGLNDASQHVLLLALAPHLCPAYATLYAYLNNDVSRRWVTPDLAARVFRAHAPNALMDALIDSSGLYRSLPESDRNKHSESLQSFGWTLNAAAADVLIRPQGSLPAQRIDTELPRDFAAYARLLRHRSTPPLLLLTGSRGSGRCALARRLAEAAGRALIVVDATTLPPAFADLDRAVQDWSLRARLSDSMVYLRGFADVDPDKDGAARRFVRGIAESHTEIVVPASAGFAWSHCFRGLGATCLTVAGPNSEERASLWQHALGDLAPRSPDDVARVASEYELTPSQIQDAGAWVTTQHRINGSADERPPAHALQEAARLHSLGRMEQLATRVRTQFDLDDLVLPRTTRSRVGELIDAVRHRHAVLERWGMRERCGGASGLVALFAGGSGTGKTMTVSVIAREVGLDAYRIDLASVVSKYIGETEKNLERIFSAAASANCILFFDEADALFGKRSEVKDAHDRHANVEIAYLLQRVEVHPGVVILATNIAKNMDPAFSRRVHYTLDFPKPTAELREQLWRGMFPPQAPLADDLDFDFLARGFELTGGEIRNLALDGAMLAAAQDSRIDMRCLIKAVARRLLSEGRAPSAAQFKQYAHLLDAHANGVALNGRAAPSPHPSPTHWS